MSGKDHGAVGGGGVTARPVDGTSGGAPMASGRRHLARVLAGGFLLILALVTIGNAESSLSDFAAAGVTVRPFHVWIWEVTSVLAWLSAAPAIWWLVAQLRTRRVGWGVVMLALIVGAPLASAWHIAVMIVERIAVYAMLGETYRFEGSITQPYLYEFRKDLGTYAQFAALAALSQWLLAWAANDVSPPPPPPPPIVTAPVLRFVEISDGALVRRVPIDEVEHVAAAGNYVELAVGGEMLLHRATLASVADELGEGFIRIHRSRLVRRDAIRAIETNQAGDFEVMLASGTRLRGSRRYRSVAEAPAF